ncbi:MULTISPECIES: DNA cytosine methyltransferase [unclassified Luteibacter]|uniref:DNA cytosine methyltransferase n=1 Tax=Luteibacter sp. PvP019 TaxID=3156436 RepID=UPI003395A5C6
MLRSVSLFSGIGGLDFGFEAAGFRTTTALEFDPTACKTMRLNKKWAVIEDDIHRVSSGAILEAGGLDEVDMLFGGPPCQPFSKSSYWANGDTLRLDDPRADTLTAYLRVVHDLKPRVLLLENVSGLTYKGKDEGLQLILRGLAQINRTQGTNYRPVWKILNAADFGVPQSRERVFIVAARDGRMFDFPLPTHRRPHPTDDSLIADDLLPCTTAWDAIGDLDAPPSMDGLTVAGKWGDLLPSIPEGQNYLWHTPRGGGIPLFGWRTRYWSFLLKLSKTLPSWTIQAQPGSAIGPFHWDNRRLTISELCRIQTFPDGLKFASGRTESQRMIGNAVPSLLAEILARQIRKQFFGARSAGKPTLLHTMPGSPPKAARVRPVHAKYLHLVGEHAPHPGSRKEVAKRAARAADPL